MSHVVGEGAAAAGPDAREMLVRLGRSWGWAAFFGVVSLAAGILALVWPGPTLLILAVIFGAQLVVGGVFRLVGAIAFDDASGGTRALLAILGLLGLIVGVYALRHLMITVLALGLILGIYWVIDGITQLFVAVDHSGMPGRGWIVASGVLGIVAGVLLLALPEVSALVLALVVGIWLIVFGIMQLAAAFQLRRLSRSEPVSG